MASTSKSKTSTSGGQTPTLTSIINGTTGDDTIFAVDGRYKGFYLNGVATIDGGNGKDLLFGTALREIMNGGASSDWVNGGGGNDTLDGGGGTGVDWVSFQRYVYSNTTYNAYASGVTVDLGLGTFSYDAFGGNRSGSATNFENLYGSDGDDTLTADARANEIRGGTGRDTIVGGAGADTLYGDAGDDVIVGGTWKPGDAILSLEQMRGMGNDNNVLMGGDGNDVLVSAVGNDWIDGGAGTGDIVDYSYLPENYSVRLTLLPGGVWTQATVYFRDPITGLESVLENDWLRNIEGVRTGMAGDEILGDPSNPNNLDGGIGDDTITGGTKDDTLDGGVDDDVVDGGDGDDLLLGAGGGNDTFKGGDGKDTLSFAPVDGKNYDPCGSLEADERSLVIDLRAGEYSWKQSLVADPWYGTVNGIEDVTGSHCGDQIAGDGGDNVLDGGNGNDVLYGAGGQDTFRGGTGDGRQGGTDADWVAFKAVTDGNTPWERGTTDGDGLPPSLMTAQDLTTENPVIMSTDGYDVGIVADLSSGGGQWRFADESNGDFKELSGTENLLGSVGDDKLTGDAGAYIVLKGVMSMLGNGDTLSFEYNGKTYSTTVTDAADLQAAIDAATTATPGDGALGDGVLIADISHGADLYLRVADATRTALGTTTANTLTDGVFIDTVSSISARQIVDGTTHYLAFDKSVAQLSEGDRVTFSRGSDQYVITLGSVANLQSALNSALQQAIWVGHVNTAVDSNGTYDISALVQADIVNTTDLLFKSAGVSLSAGTLSNLVNSGDIGARLDNVLVGDDGNDQISGGLGNDVLYGGASTYDIRDLANKPGNTVHGGDGSDTFYVGHNFDPVQASIVGEADARTEVTGTDVIRDWDDVSGGVEGSGLSGRDSLYVSAGGTAVIGGLAGQINWAGNDTVDLRSGATWEVDNAGKIVVITGAGDDTVYGSNGNDWVYTGAGRNTIALGDVADEVSDGADRVVITDWSAQYQVTGFDSDDTIYLDGKMLSAFFSAAIGDRYVGPTYAPSALADVMATDPSVLGYANDTRATADIEEGQAFDESFVNPLAELVWIAAYTSFLQDKYSSLEPSDPRVGPVSWYSNGAWTNDAHDAAEVFGTTSVSLLAYGFLGVGNGLTLIPFVGPFLAIPFYILAGTAIYDAVENTEPHLNGTYSFTSNGGQVDTYLTLFEAGQDPASAGWDTQLLDFYDLPADRFARTLEVQSHDIYDGMGTIITVYSAAADETFAYMVYSQDSMIQDNETRLIARVNGHVDADQFVVYDPATDPYYNTTVVAPVFPTAIRAISFLDDADQPIGSATRSTTVDVVVRFQDGLRAGETVRVYADVDGNPSTAPTLLETFTVLAAGSTDVGPKVGDTSVTVSYSGALASGQTAQWLFSADVTSSTGIKAPSGNFAITVDLQAPSLVAEDTDGDPVHPVQVSEGAIVFSADEDGYVGLFDANGNVVLPADLTKHAGWTAIQGQGATIEVTEQTTNITEISVVKLQDLAGNEVTVNAGGTLPGGSFVMPTIVLGRAIADTIDKSAATTNVALYGFGGADTLSGGTGADYLFGGDGNDTLSGGGGNDNLVGGAGADTLSGGTGIDTFIWNSTDEFDEGDSISGFTFGSDKLQFAAADLGSSFTVTEKVLDANDKPILVLDLGPDELPGTADDSQYELTQQIPVQLTTGQFLSGADMTTATTLDVRFFYDTTSGNLYFDADGGTATESAQLVATLTGAPTLLIGDIVLV